MKVNGNTLRPGNIIDHQKKLWRVVKISHTQPGKGGAFAQVELKALQETTKLNERFRSSESVELVRLDEKEYQYLFANGDNYDFMDNETFDQITIGKDFIGSPVVFLQEGMSVILCFHENQIVSVKLPDQVVMEIIEAEPVVKGQTASSSYKPAKIENGERIMVPPHIGIGTRVVVSTIDGSYMEKAKN